MENAKYWQERFEQLKESLLKIGDDQYADIEKQFNLTMQSIEKDITLWYKRLAINNKISYIDAKKLLTAKELKEFHWTVDEFIKKGKQSAISDKWTKQLENASARVHISRLEALKIQIQQYLESLYGNQINNIDRALQNIYADGFYKTAFEIDKGTGIGTQINYLDTEKIKLLTSKPWAPDGSNFSDRLWTDKNKLLNTLYTEITRATIRGDPLDRVIHTLYKKMNSSKSAAGRIVMTESAFFASKSQNNCFKSLDVEKYQFLATLDRKTSAICRSMDNKIFNINDYQPGVTAPPMHCWCRSCTVPYFNDDTNSKRAARGDNGKTCTVPANMNYNEWKKKCIKKDSL